jgi:hypothetical protein
MSIDMPHRQHTDLEPVEIVWKDDAEPHCWCEFGPLPGLTPEYDESGAPTGGIAQPVPPLIRLHRDDVAYIKGEYPPTSGGMRVAEALGIRMELVGDLLRIHGTNGTWTWMLHPATYEGETGFYVGRWPD